VPGLLGLDPAANGVEASVGQRDGMEGVDHLGGFGEHDRVHRRVGGRHVEGAETDALFPGLRLLVDPARYVHKVGAGQDVYDLVVLDIGHGGGIARAAPWALHKRGLVEADGARFVEPLAVGGEQGIAVGAHGVVHRVPVATELAGHLFDGPPGADLDGGPLGRSSGEQAVLGRDAVVLEDPGALGALGAATTHPVLLPPERHRCPVDRQVDVVHHRALVDQRRLGAGGAAQLIDHLLDHQLDIGPHTFVVDHADIFQADQCLEDLSRVSEDEGAFRFLGLFGLWRGGLGSSDHDRAEDPPVRFAGI
jgi:hypothetical protein